MDTNLIDVQKQDEEFYQKRYELVNKERDILKNENKVLRKELVTLKEFVKKISIPKHGNNKPEPTTENDLYLVLELQRKKIDSLQKDLDDLKLKYEKLLIQRNREGQNVPESVKLAEDIFSPEAALNNANDRIKLLEAKIQESTSNSAKEIMSLKSKLVESQASVILGVNNGLKSSNSTMDLLNKTTIDKDLNSIPTPNHLKELKPLSSTRIMKPQASTKILPSKNIFESSSSDTLGYLNNTASLKNLAPIDKEVLFDYKKKR